jgi:two-component SAPR family response regulator
MPKYIYVIAVALFLKINCFAQHGLAFNSYEVVLEKRTSLDLSPEDSFCFTKNFELRFDINFIPNNKTYFGYVIRIISNGNQNIDLIFDQKSKYFKVINGEKFSNISFTVDSSRLFNQWNNFSLKFNLENQTLQFNVNGKLVGNSSIPMNFRCFKFLWGANDFQKFKTRDIPHMQIKDVKIFEDYELKYFWPLSETSGDIGYDTINKQAAKVKNPVWISPKYQKWELLSSFTINGYSGVAYDAKQDKIYVTGSDSLAVYPLKNEQNTVNLIPSNHLNLRQGNQAIFDTATNKLYDIFIDQKKVVAFNFDKRQWDDDFETGEITEFWHANKFISTIDSSLYIIGGYGRLKYKNLVQRYTLTTKKWEVVAPLGDYFAPRYLAALGIAGKRDFVYIIGGYGSLTGDQMLDPGNQYDLLRYDVRRKSFKKMYSLTPATVPFTFANSLVIGPKQDEYYGLIFPNDSSSSNLQLIKGSLTDSSFRLLGNSIPFKFHDIESFADLYYSPLSNKLIAVILRYASSDDKEKITEVKIYSLSFPPEPFDTTGTNLKATNKWHFFPFIFFGGLIICGIVFFIFKRRAINVKLLPKGKLRVPVTINESKSITVADNPYFHGQGEKNVVSSIYLFGQFQVFDKKGDDITGLFTPLLKELFLIICINTIRNGRGISSGVLDEILWRDKSEKDAKNNRAVNIVKLKIIVEKIGNCIISKESGYWQFQILEEAIYVDYNKYILSIQYASDYTKDYIYTIVDIIKRGSFLYHTEYAWLDDIKSEISGLIIDLCLDFIKSQDLAKDPELIIEIANRIFYFDQLNEDALIYKCKSLILLKRHTLANNVYLKFLKDYKDIYGTEFKESFNDVIA